MVRFYVKYHFAYIMKIYRYKRTFFIEKHDHNVTQYEIMYIYILMMMSSPYPTFKSKKFDIL